MGIVTPGGVVLKKIKYGTHISEGREPLLKRLVSHLKDLIRKDLNSSHPWIGIGVAGSIDRERGIIVHSPNLPDLEGFGFRDFLSKKFSHPIVIENDANAFTLGEGWRGAARGAKHFCGITLGTGVGGGIVVEGKILHGKEGMAGEVGHMVIEPNGLACGCGGRGCLEVYASGKGIQRMALEAIKKGRGKVILKGGRSHFQKITSEDVFKAAQKGDTLAKGIFDKMGAYLGLGLVNLIHLFNPEKIVIGGNVSKAWDFFIEKTMETIQERSMKGPRDRTEIVQSRCGDEAGILGAAYAALIKARQGA
jgi:glucokinase